VVWLLFTLTTIVGTLSAGHFARICWSNHRRSLRWFTINSVALRFFYLNFAFFLYVVPVIVDGKLWLIINISLLTIAYPDASVSVVWLDTEAQQSDVGHLRRPRTRAIH